MASTQSSATSKAFSTLLTHIHVSYQTYVYPFLPAPLQIASSTVERILSHVLGAPDIVSLAALLVSIYMTLKIAEYIRRTIWGWITLAIKILFVVMLVQVFFYVQNYGWERTVRDASWIGGMLWDYVGDMMVQAQQDNDTRRNPYGAYPTGRGRGGNGGSDYGFGKQQAPMAGKKKGRSGWR